MFLLFALNDLIIIILFPFLLFFNYLLNKKAKRHSPLDHCNKSRLMRLSVSNNDLIVSHNRSFRYYLFTRPLTVKGLWAKFVVRRLMSKEVGFVVTSYIMHLWRWYIVLFKRFLLRNSNYSNKVFISIV